MTRSYQGPTDNPSTVPTYLPSEPSEKGRDKYKDMDTVVLGKVEAREARKGQTLVVLPNKVIEHLSFLEIAD